MEGFPPYAKLLNYSCSNQRRPLQPTRNKSAIATTMCTSKRK
ncbi:Uncharacterized protein APZ42_028108 [Daphnia magna]|uniref:Uncharacterized protein n=1 Tax=Daphnia magna TaxID=35525 RepID=A0A164QTS6_9CRUS|nr:Uncharacterized protein APZ42_028108 [Daphnia magna]